MKKDIDKDSYIKADPTRLKQIFVNLLSNTNKFTPEGGRSEVQGQLGKGTTFIIYLDLKRVDTAQQQANPHPADEQMLTQLRGKRVLLTR